MCTCPTVNSPAAVCACYYCKVFAGAVGQCTFACVHIAGQRRRFLCSVLREACSTGEAVRSTSSATLQVNNRKGARPPHPPPPPSPPPRWTPCCDSRSSSTGSSRSPVKTGPRSSEPQSRKCWSAPACFLGEDGSRRIPGEKSEAKFYARQ